MNMNDMKRIVEFILYILNTTGGTDIYHINKILYFAEMDHIVKNGLVMIPGGFVAMEYGPVPENIYKSLKYIGNKNFVMSVMLGEVIDKLGDEASDIFVAKRKSDNDYISESEIESLDKAIAENANMSFTQLKNKSHDIAWKEAYSSKDKKILKADMIAKAGNASDGMIEYIREQMELDKILS